MTFMKLQENLACEQAPLIVIGIRVFGSDSGKVQDKSVSQMCIDVASLRSSHFLLAKREKREPRVHGAKRSKKIRSGGGGEGPGRKGNACC